MAIGFYAKTNKEAQTLGLPITFLAMIPAMATSSLDIGNIPGIYFNIPLLNMVCVIRELFGGVIHPDHIAVCFGWSAVYLAIAFCIYLAAGKNEKCLFRQ